MRRTRTPRSRSRKRLKWGCERVFTKLRAGRLLVLRLVCAAASSMQRRPIDDDSSFHGRTEKFWACGGVHCILLHWYIEQRVVGWRVYVHVVTLLCGHSATVVVVVLRPARAPNSESKGLTHADGVVLRHPQSVQQADDMQCLGCWPPCFEGHTT